MIAAEARRAVLLGDAPMPATWRGSPKPRRPPRKPACWRNGGGAGSQILPTSGCTACACWARRAKPGFGLEVVEYVALPAR
jgi:hypothetical protein